MNLPNIFLIGFMGSGKSHWGRIWAERFQMSFMDLDAEIEKAYGMSIDRIFEKDGEEKFREIEKYQLKKNENGKNLMISCGGGTPCYFDNLEWMKKNGYVVYLKASEYYILDRVKDETNQRPLLKKVNPAELLFFIQQKLKERTPFYEKANYILDVTSLTPESIDSILKNESFDVDDNLEKRIPPNQKHA